MKQAWWILCNIGVFLIIRSAWIQMTGFDKWTVVLLLSAFWMNSLLDDLNKAIKP